MNKLLKDAGVSVYVLLELAHLSRPALLCWAPNSPSSPHPSSFHPVIPTFLSALAPQVFFLLLLLMFYRELGGWSLPLPTALTLGSTLVVSWLSWKGGEAGEWRRGRGKGKTRHLVGPDIWGVCIFLSCSLGSMLNLTLICLIWFFGI